MPWFRKDKPPKRPADQRPMQVPEGTWGRCPGCSEILHRDDIEAQFHVCPRCGHHYRLPLERRIDLLCDPGTSFHETENGLRPLDPLNFRDQKRYSERLKAARKATGRADAVRTGHAVIGGHDVMLGLFDFRFLGGSMGSVVGEKIARLLDAARELERPAVVVTASGGARMQEGLLSLMQMAKTTAAVAALRRGSRVPLISLLTHPTTGGVAASFATQADVVLAEPNALIGFAGPRVIQQTIRTELPDGFQQAEGLLEHGMVDRIVPRSDLRDTLRRLLDLLHPPSRRSESHDA